MKKGIFAFIGLFLASNVQAQTYNQVQWGMNRAIDPYALAVNLNGSWYPLGTVSSTGVWSITTDYSFYTPTWAKAVGRVLTARLQDTASINDFGGTSSASTATCNTSAGSNILSCSNIADFAVGQSVLIFGAGDTTSAQATSLNVTQCAAQGSTANTGWCTPGTTTYYYTVAALTATGGIGPTIAEISAPGPDTLSAYNFNAVRWRNPTPAPTGYVILSRDATLRPNRRPIGFQASTVTTTVGGISYVYFNDYGPDNVFNLTTTQNETWLPNNADITAQTYGWLRSNISAINKTTNQITLVDSNGVAVNAGASLSAATVYHENTNALQAAIAASKTVTIPCGTYIFSGESIPLTSGTSLVGASKNCSTMNVIGGTISTTRRFLGGNSISNVTVSDLTINFNNNTQVNGSVLGFTVGSQVTLNNLNILNYEKFGISGYLNNSKISNNYIYLQYPYLSQNECITPISGSGVLRGTNNEISSNICDGSSIFVVGDNSRIINNKAINSCFGDNISEGGSTLTFKNSFIGNSVTGGCTETVQTATATVSASGNILSVIDDTPPTPAIILNNIRIGDKVQSANIPAGTKIIGFGNAIGRAGTYFIDPPVAAPVAAETASFFNSSDVNAAYVSCYEIWGSYDIIANNNGSNCAQGFKIGTAYGTVVGNTIYDSDVGFLLNYVSPGTISARNITMTNNVALSTSGNLLSYGFQNTFTTIGGISQGTNNYTGSVAPAKTLYNNNTLALNLTPANVTGGSWATNVATLKYSGLELLQSGTAVVVAGVTPAGYNGTYVLTGASANTSLTEPFITYALSPDPGAYVSGGTITISGFGKANSTVTLIDPLRQNVTAGTRYTINGSFNFTADVAGGVRLALGGNATASNINVEAKLYCTSTSPGTLVSIATLTAFVTPIRDIGCTTYYAELKGTLTATSDGTIGPAFAQDTTAAATPSVMLNGSQFNFTKAPF